MPKTATIVRRKILRSSQSDQFSMRPHEAHLFDGDPAADPLEESRGTNEPATPRVSHRRMCPRGQCATGGDVGLSMLMTALAVGITFLIPVSAT
jgi:hypothetical protein